MPEVEPFPEQAADPPTPKATRPPTLSPSAASTFRQCARRWKFRYVDRLPDPPTESTLRGNFVHRVLEDLLEMEPQQRTLEVAKKLCRKLWPEVADHYGFKRLHLSDDDQRLFRWQAWTDVQGFFDLVDPPEVEVEAREFDVRTDLAGVPFRGVVDLLDRTPDGLRVTDYKTGRAPSNRFVDSRLTQVWLYAAALEAEGNKVASVRMLYLGETGRGLKVRRPTDINRAFDPEVTAAAVSEHSETWVQIGEAVATGVFEPKPGTLCGWCAYRESCPEGQAEFERRQLAA